MKKRAKKLSLHRETIARISSIVMAGVAGGTFEDTGITCTICDIPIGSHPFGDAAGPLERDHDNICA